MSPQMNQAVHLLRHACLPAPEVGQGRREQVVSDLTVDFEVLWPIEPERFAGQVLEAVEMNR